MPEATVETAPVTPTVEQGKAEEIALSGDFDTSVNQLLAVEKQTKQEKKPEIKPEARVQENVQGKETSPTPVQSDTVDMVYIKGENGEELEASVADIAKDIIGEDASVKDGKVYLEVQVGDKTYEADVDKVRKWASMGINANERIRVANETLNQAEGLIASFPQQVQTEADKLADQKVARIIDDIANGKKPFTNESFDDDSMRQGAENLASRLQTSQLEQRLKAQEDRYNQDTQTRQQREQAQRNEQLRVQAQSKSESILDNFKKQFVKADGKTFDNDYYSLFQENVGNRLIASVANYRRQIGQGPDIAPEWVANETSRIAKEIFPKYSERIKSVQPIKPKATAASLKPTGIQKGIGKPNQKPQPKSSLTKSWDEELRDAYAEAGKPLKV